MRPQVAFKFLIWSLSGDKQPSYKHFPAVGAFSLKFSIAPSGETTDRIKKSQGVQKWYGPPLSPCQAWWGSWVARGCRRKSVVFFVCLFVTLWNYKVCDNGNAMKQCYFQNNYGVIAQRKAYSCAPIFKFFCGPLEFSFRGKTTIFRDFGGCKPTF